LQASITAKETEMNTKNNIFLIDVFAP